MNYYIYNFEYKWVNVVLLKLQFLIKIVIFKDQRLKKNMILREWLLKLKDIIEDK